MQFARYIGIDYSGAQTPNDSLKGLRVYFATTLRTPEEVQPPPSPKRYWTRRGLAEWLGDQLESEAPTIVGIDHGFSFPLAYFERHGLLPDWYASLRDFVKHWPTHEDHTYVDFLRDGPRATGKARQGDTRWRRLTELAAGSAKSVFHFDVQGSVAKSTHSGIPWLLHLKERHGERLHVWPFDGWVPPPGKHVLVEAYPRLFSSQFPPEDRNGDQHDAFAVCAWLQAREADGSLGSYFEPDLAPDEQHVAGVEGWIIGLKTGPAVKPKTARTSVHQQSDSSARLGTAKVDLKHEGNNKPRPALCKSVCHAPLAAFRDQAHISEPLEVSCTSIRKHMQNRPSDLPDFSNPPLNEVAMSVQFAKLDQFRIVHAGSLWEQFREEGDRVEYLQPLPPLFEQFGIPRPGLQQVQFQLMDAPELPRMWFVRENGADLIQFQPDRFIHNWRKAGTEATYPRYENILAQFTEEFQKLETFVSENRLGNVVPNQCELTYVNLIKQVNGIDPLIFSPPSSVCETGLLEDSSVSVRYRLDNDIGAPIGRLHVQTMPVIDAQGERALQLSITGRGPPAEANISAVVEFMNLARAAIVHAFAKVTSPAMHLAWGRKV